MSAGKKAAITRHKNKIATRRADMITAAMKMGQRGKVYMQQRRENRHEIATLEEKITPLEIKLNESGARIEERKGCIHLNFYVMVDRKWEVRPNIKDALVAIGKVPWDEGRVFQSKTRKGMFPYYDNWDSNVYNRIVGRMEIKALKLDPELTQLYDRHHVIVQKLAILRSQVRELKQTPEYYAYTDQKWHLQTLKEDIKKLTNKMHAAEEALAAVVIIDSDALKAEQADAQEFQKIRQRLWDIHQGKADLW